MATPARIIQLPPASAPVEHILIQDGQTLEIIGNNLTFWSENEHLHIYENGQLKAVLENYYQHFNAAPMMDVGSSHYISVVSEPTITEAALLASQTGSHEGIAAAAIHTGAGATSGVSAGWIVGGLLLAGGAAAAAGGGGGDDGDDSSDNPNEHNGSVSASTFTGEAVTTTPYFINVLLTEDKVGFLDDSQIWAGVGSPIKVTYSFADSANEQIYGTWSNVLTGFQQYTAEQKAGIKAVMQEYSYYTNIEFEEVDSDAAADFVIYLDDLAQSPMDESSEVLMAYAYTGGNLHINSQIYSANNAFNENEQFTWSTYKSDKNDGFSYPFQNGYSVVMHELGHVFGLEHPFKEDSPDVPKDGFSSAENVDITTVMTYNAYEVLAELEVPDRPGYTYSDIEVYQTNLGVYDIATLHYLYGVNANFNSGDNTYTFDSFNYMVNGSDGTAIGNVYIADGAGIDTIDASNYSTNVFIDLTSGSWNYVGEKAATLALNASGGAQSGQLFIGYGSQIENAKGGSGDDTLQGNSADNFLYGFSGNDTINGGAGNDQLEGGQGADILIGGAGADSFFFRSNLDDTVDTIRDFSSSENDTIHLGQSIFSQLGTTSTTGTLQADQFVLGTAALDENDFIIFDSSSNQLFYDADGNGANAAVAIVKLENLDTLSAEQVFIM